MSEKGFSLIELLIAMVIFTVIASIAYSSLNHFNQQSKSFEEASTSLAKLQKAMILLERDFMQLVPRSIRNEDNTNLPAMYYLNDEKVLEFTRSGRGAAGISQSTLLRVQYRYEDKKLIRKTWGRLDRVYQTASSQTVLLEDISDFRLRFLDSRAWKSQWPPDLQKQEDQPIDSSSKALPRVIQIQFKSKRFGNIKRLMPANLL